MNIDRPYYYLIIILATSISAESHLLLITRLLGLEEVSIKARVYTIKNIPNRYRCR